MSNLTDHAKRELTILGMGPDDKNIDPIDRLMGGQILKMVSTFAEQGHSGLSASYAVGALERLLRFEPITPLTGEADEWNDISEIWGKPAWQNIRCSRVFKDENGRAYDSSAVVFRDKNGSTWTNGKSHRKISFPYTPTTKYVNRRWWKFWL